MAVLASGGAALSKLYGFAPHPAFYPTGDADVGWNDGEAMRRKHRPSPRAKPRETL